MATGKSGPADVVFLVDGYDMLANKITSLNVKIEAMQVESTGLGDSFEEHTPLGVSKAEITQDGAFFDTETDHSHDALSASVPTSAQAVPRILCVAMAGNAIGEPAIAIEGAFTMEYEPIAFSDDLTKANVAYLITGKAEHALILQELEAKVADWNTEGSEAVDYTLDRKQAPVEILTNSQANPTEISTGKPHGLTSGDLIKVTGVSGSDIDINFATSGILIATVVSPTLLTVPINCTTSGGTGGSFVRADSANGGAGYLFVISDTGFTNFIAEIRDSPDDSTYAPLVVFTDTTGTAPFTERIAVAGDVDQFLAVDGDVTGSAEITTFILFARNE